MLNDLNNILWNIEEELGKGLTSYGNILLTCSFLTMLMNFFFIIVILRYNVPPKRLKVVNGELVKVETKKEEEVNEHKLLEGKGNLKVDKKDLDDEKSDLRQLKDNENSRL